MNPTYRLPPSGEVLSTGSVRLTTPDWAKLDALAAELAVKLGVIPSRGRAVEHLLALYTPSEPS